MKKPTEKYLKLLSNAHKTRVWISQNPGCTYAEIQKGMFGIDTPVMWLLTKNYIYRRKNEFGLTVYFVKPMQDFQAEDETISDSEEGDVANSAAEEMGDS